MSVGGRSWRKRQSGSGAVMARLLGDRMDSWWAKDSGTGAVVALVPGDTNRRYQKGDTKGRCHGRYQGDTKIESCGGEMTLGNDESGAGAGGAGSRGYH
jgi:hypothetical protein